MNKKTMLAISALCATVAFQAKAIESDVVGYAQSGFDQGGWMIPVGVAFSNVASQDGTFTLDDNFFAGTAQEGDQMITFDGDFWNVNQYDKLGEGAGWMFMPADGGDSEVVESITLGKGDFIYYTPMSGEEITIAGKVANPSAAQSITFDLDNELGQWMFPLVNPFPVDTTWGEIDTFAGEGDQIITFDGDYWNINQYDRLGDGDGWMLVPADGGSSEVVNEPEAIAIPAGGAVYYAPQQTTTWTVEL